MPLNRPALSLGAGPRSVQDARRWVVATFVDIGRSDLVECAEMAVSELVTNALLHGAPPIRVRVRGTREHPRIEVGDGSTEAPALPAPPTGDDLDDLLTFGRGLSIVARASDAWGADIEDEGKTVWCAPAAEFAEDDGAEGIITGLVGGNGQQGGDQPADPMRFRLLNVPVRDYASFYNHFRELRREVRLLAMAHEADYPLAKDLADVFAQLGRPLTLGAMRDEVGRAQEEGLTHTDLEVVMGRTEARGVRRFVELLDLTDAFAREEKMLSLARTPEQHTFQTWFLGEFVRQADGGEPTAFPTSTGSEQRRSSVS
ncbi:ATP-binding protein [Nocardioides dongxiaopingii]|uniref:ATP-binding protein n=1 Tax=Nocardioides sp. S-1144 TaxID=2582905 RepID=UPI0010C76398|nr:ATP-binding protein [Nocardioides sp. S-1144]QDH11137.1 ATP-binding protein [Nocardioides sp. S-1144]